MLMIKAYIRIAKMTNGRYKVDARARTPNYAPIADSNGGPYPTVAFALEFNIPEEAFEQAEQVIAEITIPEDQLQIAAEVVQ